MKALLAALQQSNALDNRAETERKNVLASHAIPDDSQLSTRVMVAILLVHSVWYRARLLTAPQLVTFDGLVGQAIVSYTTLLATRPEGASLLEALNGSSQPAF